MCAAHDTLRCPCLRLRKIYAGQSVNQFAFAFGVTVRPARLGGRLLAVAALAGCAQGRRRRTMTGSIATTPRTRPPSSSGRRRRWWSTRSRAASWPPTRPRCAASATRSTRCAPKPFTELFSVEEVEPANLVGKLRDATNRAAARDVAARPGRLEARRRGRLLQPGAGRAPGAGGGRARRQRPARGADAAAGEAPAARSPRAPRPADRSAQPAVSRRAPARRDRGGEAPRHRARGAVPRPRPLQAHQRLARPRDRRQAAEDRGAAHPRDHAQRGRRGAHGRRRVRRGPAATSAAPTR